MWDIHAVPHNLQAMAAPSPEARARRRRAYLLSAVLSVPALAVAAWPTVSCQAPSTLGDCLTRSFAWAVVLVFLAWMPAIHAHNPPPPSA